MKNRIRLTIAGLLILNGWIHAQSLEKRLQAVIDSIYAAHPSSVGIMVHLESPDHGISWSTASDYSSKDPETRLDPDQPALIASNIKTYVSASILLLVEKGELSVDQPIRRLLSDKTRILFEQGGYKLDSIRIKHLLSHTSGIQDYANQQYIDFIDNNKTHRWTRDEQLELTIQTGAPLGLPGTTFNYADANYLLLTEVIEHFTHKPFYTAMRELIGYDALGLNDTWMPTLEAKPGHTKAMVHQYWGSYNWDSYDVDVSADLYGGGGIACTTSDLANFLYDLFNFNIIKDTATLNLIFTEIPTRDASPGHYYFGLSSDEYLGFKAYGHNGFWGTVAMYFPELNTSIAVYVLEKDMSKLRQEIIEKIMGLLRQF